MKIIQQYLNIIVMVVALLSAVSGIYFWAENRYALTITVKNIQVQFEYKVLSDRLEKVQERLWRLEDRFSGVPKGSSKEEYRELLEEKDKIKDKLKNFK